MERDIRKAEAGGVEFAYDAAKLDDVRVVFAIGKLSDDAVGDEDKLTWYTRLMDMLFTDPWAVMSQLAEANGGTLTVDGYNAFFVAAMEAMQAKN